MGYFKDLFNRKKKKAVQARKIHRISTNRRSSGGIEIGDMMEAVILSEALEDLPLTTFTPTALPYQAPAESFSPAPVQEIIDHIPSSNGYGGGSDSYSSGGSSSYDSSSDSGGCGGGGSDD